MAALDRAAEAFGQAGPVAGVDEEGDVRLARRFHEGREPRRRDLAQARAAQGEIEVAGVMAAPVDAAAVGPRLDAGQMRAQQSLERPPVAPGQEKRVNHRSPPRRYPPTHARRRENREAFSA